MSIAQTSPESTPSGSLVCPNCHAPLPPHAIFCSSCGERIDKQKHASSLLQNEVDITTRYRITSLIRRRPYVNLYFALDNQQPSHAGQSRMVAIRDIDITSLNEDERGSAIKIVQQEYDFLRRWQLPHVMPVIDLRYFQGHLFVITGSPTTQEVSIDKTRGADGHQEGTQRLYTLQDFLQSGQGLPPEQRTLEWMTDLCQALDGLHHHQVVVGDLDPYTIILNANTDGSRPSLMISWLLPQLRKLLPPPSSPMKHMSYFTAPEALLGPGEPRSDIYSLGAILYLLLTGTPPDESVLRTRRRLRSPRELNSHISPNVDECVMQALSVDPADRFASVAAMAEALRNPRFRRPQEVKQSKLESKAEDVTDVETVRIVPLSHKSLARWQAARPQTIPHRPLSPGSTKRSEQVEGREAAGMQQRSPQIPSAAPSQTIDEVETIDIAPLVHDVAGTQKSAENRISTAREASTALSGREAARPSPSRPLQSPQRPTTPWKQRIPAILPAIAPGPSKTRQDVQAPAQYPGEITSPTGTDVSWFKRLQRMILGRQEHTTTAAAIIETPMRVQPDQEYTIRMHIMGRDEQAPPPGAARGAQAAGMSALMHGDTLLIEVRSALHQSYTYIVQQATVTVPATGYVAEVTIPMRPLSSGPSGRRDRLHIFFMDGLRHPLYEKPFVLELFVSHLVQPGREGHNILTIPV